MQKRLKPWEPFHHFVTKTRLGCWALEVWLIFWCVTKITLPILFLVRLIEVLGWIEELALIIEPLMAWVGLPGEMGVVWITAMVSGIYAAMAVFYQLGGAEQLTIAQVSILGTMILVAHALPVEAAIAKATGVSLWFTLIWRIGGGLLLGILLHYIYSGSELLQTPIPTLWQPELGYSNWGEWFIFQGKILLAVLAIIAGLTLMIRVLRYLGIEKLIHLVLAPILRLLGIGKQASHIMIVGLSLGIAIGGGMLIQEARSGKLDGKDVFMSMAFLGLCHSLIEDTLLVLLLGADLSAILWARLGFSLIVLTLLARLLNLLSSQQQRWFYRLPSN